MLSSQHVVRLYWLSPVNSGDCHVGVLVGAKLSHLVRENDSQCLNTIIAAIGNRNNLNLLPKHVLNGGGKVNAELKGHVEVTCRVRVD